MARKLYIHLGPSKTGTSAIQSFLRDNPSKSILYPETGRWPDGSHHKLVFALGGRTKYGTIDIPPFKKLLLQLEEEISNSAKDVLLSSEVSSIQFVEALTPIASKYDLDIRLILVVRNPLERASSAYNQGVKDAVVGLSEDPDEYLRNRNNDFRFKPLYEKWSTLNRPIVVIPYHCELPLIERFCSILGIRLDSLDTVRQPNKSMGGVALLAILIANKILRKEQERRAFFADLQKNEALKIWRGESFPFSIDAGKNFYSAIKSDIDWIVDTFNFPRTVLMSTSRKPFSLTKNEVDVIYDQLRKTNLLEQNQNLITETIKPFCQ